MSLIAKWLTARLVETIFIIVFIVVMTAFWQDNRFDDSLSSRLILGLITGGKVSLLYNIYLFYLPVSALTTFALVKISASNGVVLALSNSAVHALYGLVIFFLFGLFPFYKVYGTSIYDWTWAAVIIFNLIIGFFIYRRAEPCR